jgi:hypothetical protein
MNLVKKTLFTALTLSIAACTTSIPNNNRDYLIKDDFRDLDKEYVFATKALSASYFERKIRKWLELDDGGKLVKELKYAGYKFPEAYCDLTSADPGLKGQINAIGEVTDREESDVSFREFIDSCEEACPVPSLSTSGSEFRANTYLPTAQTRSKMSMDDAGDFIITWTSGYSNLTQDGSQYGVYAQRYFSTGSPNGSEFLVNTYTTNRQAFSTVAMDKDGDFVIAWQGEGPGDSYGVFARRFDSAGVGIGTEFLVNNFVTNAQFFPSIAMDGQGNFIIAWQSNGAQDGANAGVYARRFFSNGSPDGGEFKVNNYTTGQQGRPSVASDNAGDFVISWHGKGADDIYGIFARRYDSAGNAGNDFRVNSVTAPTQNFSSVAMDNAGDFVITWQSFNQDEYGYGIFAQRYDSVGSPVGVEFPVNDYSAGNQSYPAVVMNASGDFVITWSGQGPNQPTGVFAKVYSSGGEVFTSEFRVSTFTGGFQWLSSAAMDSNGDFAVSWTSYNQDDNTSYPGIYAQRYNFTGTSCSSGQ